jgi:hypothetical protein
MNGMSARMVACVYMACRVISPCVRWPTVPEPLPDLLRLNTCNKTDTRRALHQGWWSSQVTNASG